MKIYKCEICGHIEVLKESIECCGQLMDEMKVNNEEFSSQKHIPVLVREDGLIKVSIGEVLHPMTSEHLIEWVIFVNGDAYEKVEPMVDSEPVLYFDDAENIVVYAYCNLHGLWKRELE